MPERSEGMSCPGKWFAVLFACNTYVNVELRLMCHFGDDSQLTAALSGSRMNCCRSLGIQISRISSMVPMSWRIVGWCPARLDRWTAALFRRSTYVGVKLGLTVEFLFKSMMVVRCHNDRGDVGPHDHVVWGSDFWQIKLYYNLDEFRMKCLMASLAQICVFFCSCLKSGDQGLVTATHLLGFFF
jgi:hypothetical protein